MAEPVLIDGEWTTEHSAGIDHNFYAVNPATREDIPAGFQKTHWSGVEAAIASAAAASKAMRGWPGERFAVFLETYAGLIEGNAAELVEMAHAETALAVEPRLKDVELPRTTNQLRLAAAAARSGIWTCPTIDTATGIRSMFGPVGPCTVFGPNNFPFAFNSIAGGDFASAVAAGNPVIAKGNTSHPGTTRLFGQLAHQASTDTDMPKGFVQLIYRTSHEDGKKLVSHSSIGATGFTGSLAAGLTLKAAADAAGNPFYAELSSTNPVVVLPGALAERSEGIAGEFTGSCLMATGQFCTNPGLVLLLAGEKTDAFIGSVVDAFDNAPNGTLLSESVTQIMCSSVRKLKEAGAEVLCGGNPIEGATSHENTALRVGGGSFLNNSDALQTEAFGNATLFVVATDLDQLLAICEKLDGQLTGCIYSDTAGSDDAMYDAVAPILRTKVGRLLNDKMPTGVAVSSAMNHGGPFPATGHPGFSAVGMPQSIPRFGMLQSYDNVRAHRLPRTLQRKGIVGLQRCIDGNWTKGNIPEDED